MNIKIILCPNDQSLSISAKFPKDNDLACLIRDHKLPISVNRKPYFSYFMNLYDSFFPIKDKYDLLVNAINHPEIGNLNISKYGLTIADKICDQIKSPSKISRIGNQ